MNETRPAASDRRRGGAHLRRGRGWSRSMVAGGLLAGLLLFAMAVLTQPRASAWTDPPEVHQDSAPADSDEESASSVDGKTGFEAQAADAVAADAAAALDEMAGSEQAPVAAAGAGPRSGLVGRPR